MRLTPATWTRRIESPTTGIREWGRGRLLSILATALVVAVVLLLGLVYAIYLAVTGLTGFDAADAGVATGETSTPGRVQGRVQGQAHRDDLAAAPMLEVPDDAMDPADPAAEATAPIIEIPAGTTPGPGLVMTGFPHTPEGAIGQLAQIDVAALQAMSIRTAQDIYLNWALPGGVGPQRWWITASVQSFLTATDMGEEKDPGSHVAVEPAAALVKGTDGPDWVTACVLFRVTASYRQDGQVAFGHCERMQWVGGRWMIAPGQPPAPAPSTWPGTELANEAGWRTWVTAHSSDDETHSEGSH
jgi:hypothetical protein